MSEITCYYKAYIHVEHCGELFVMLEDVPGLFALHHPGKNIPQNALVHNCMITNASISQGAGNRVVSVFLATQN